MSEQNLKPHRPSTKELEAKLKEMERELRLVDHQMKRLAVGHDNVMEALNFLFEYLSPTKYHECEDGLN